MKNDKNNNNEWGELANIPNFAIFAPLLPLVVLAFSCKINENQIKEECLNTFYSLSVDIYRKGRTFLLIRVYGAYYFQHLFQQFLRYLWFLLVFFFFVS